MKKIIVLFLALTVAVSIAACSKKSSKETTSLKNGEAVSMDVEDFTIEDNGTTAKDGSGKSDSGKTATTKKGEATTKKGETTTKKSSVTTKKNSTTQKGGSSEQTTVTDTEKYETPIIPIG
ncbi:MAG: hypothetical protein IJG23_04250 [Clostridia bacterium]|nr:hypothetical protein [Clostridia bacterium]